MRFAVNSNDMMVTKLMKFVFDEMRVKIRRCQVIKLIPTGFVVVQENIKPSVLMHRPCKLGLYF